MADTVYFKAPKFAEADDDKFTQNAEALTLLDAALAEASPYAPDNVNNLDAAGTLSGLTFGYLSGELRVGTSLVTTARGTVALTGSATNYVELDPAGTVSANTTGFTPGRIPLHQVTCDATDMTAIVDKRAFLSVPANPLLSKSVAGAADVNLTAAEALHDILELTGALTGNINVIVPTTHKQWTVFNNTSGAFTLTVKTSAGTGITITQGMRRILYSDGTNVVAAAAEV